MTVHVESERNGAAAHQFANRLDVHSLCYQDGNRAALNSFAPFSHNERGIDERIRPAAEELFEWTRPELQPSTTLHRFPAPGYPGIEESRALVAITFRAK